MKSIQFDYRFIPKGSTVEVEYRDHQEMFVFRTENPHLISNAYLVEDVGDKGSKKVFYPSASTIFLAVGNDLREGIVDHNHLKNAVVIKGSELQSTADILAKCPSFMSNLGGGKDHVTVFVHSDPDFDAFTSAYLVTYYVKHKRLPTHFAAILEYAIEIDSGRMGIHGQGGKQVVTPYTIALVIAYVIQRDDVEFNQFKKEEKWFDMVNRFDHLLLQRGFALIDYLLERLGELAESERTLNHPNILRPGHPFLLEQAAVLEDFKKYQEDLKTRCEKKSIRLPHRTNPGEVLEVDGLFWNDFPTCQLHKLWARSDVSSPSKTGYVFTFIPSSFNTRTNTEDLAKFAPEIRPYIETVTRVIVSVNPAFPVSLKGLGRQLEREEQKKELELLGDQWNKWRMQMPRRFEDEWCVNNDPWYDGRYSDYTIVDAPRNGSILTLEEIRRVSLDFTETKVIKPFSRIVYSFKFDFYEYDHLCQSLTEQQHVKQISYHDQKERVQYFSLYIQRYLFNVNDDGSKAKETFSCRFSVDYGQEIPIDFFVDAEHRICYVQQGTETDTVQMKRIRARIQQVNIALFRYGVGFLIIDTTVDRDEVQDHILMRSVLSVNKELCEGVMGKRIVIDCLKLWLGPSFAGKKFEDGLIYTNITIDHQTFFRSEQEKIMFNLCSNSLMSTTFQRDSDQMRNSLSKMIYSFNDHVVYSYSKKGKALIFIDHDRGQEHTEKSKEMLHERAYLKRRFKTVDFDTFLLVLHQRHSLVHFSKLLSEYGLENPEVSKLRDTLYDFIVQGWFSQITKDDIGMDRYKKWKQTFETETLYEEVKEQVSTIDDYQNAKKSNQDNQNIAKISTIVLPASVITGIFGMNVPFIHAESMVTGVVAVGLAIVAYSILIYWMNKEGFIKEYPFAKIRNRLFGQKTVRDPDVSKEDN